MGEDDEKAIEDDKIRGLEQVKEEFIIKMAMKNKTNWGGIWKAIKGIDKDSNGFVTADELECIFKEFFPIDLDKKSLFGYFKKFRSI